jgi:hypothetical protein
MPQVTQEETRRFSASPVTLVTLAVWAQRFPHLVQLPAEVQA